MQRRFSEFLSEQCSKVSFQLFFSLLILNFILQFPIWLRQANAVGFLPKIQHASQFLPLVSGNFDLLILVTVLLLIRNTNFFTFARRVVVGIFITLLLFEVYTTAIFELFRRPPIITGDIYLLKDAIYLLLNPQLHLWIPIILIGVLFYSILFKIIPGLFQAIAGYFSTFSLSRRPDVLIAIAWLLLAFLPLTVYTPGDKPVPGLSMIRLTDNLWDSVQFTRLIRETNFSRQRARFEKYTQRSVLNRPDIYLIMFESYGKVMATNKRFRNEYRRWMNEFADSLQVYGWYAASNYSTSPVTGGGSWLSSATVLSGTRINNQPLYENYIKQQPGSLVDVLNSFGYDTMMLHPSDRARPGLPVESRFRYNRQIIFDSLAYHGRSFGWGIVPDQYSLNYTFKHYLSQDSTPVFLDFTSVSSHSNWLDGSIPPLVHHWQDLKSTTAIDSCISTATQFKLFIHQLYKTDNLDRLIHYDLKVFLQFILHKTSDNSLIILVGDHQPPIVAGKADGMETPIHIISRDFTLMRELRRFGFFPGMYKAPDASGSIAHQDIYPLIMEVVFPDSNTTPNASSTIARLSQSRK